MFKIKYFIFAFASILFSGCIPSLQPSHLHDNALLGEHHKVAMEADKKKDLKSKLDESNQLPTLYAGNSYLFCNDYKKSLARFNEAERIIKFHNEEILLGSTGDLIAQLLLNDAVIDFHATIVDGIMINTYKAIDYMALGDNDGARIEFNRAIDRQRRAKELYAKMVQKTKDAIKKKQQEENKKLKEEQAKKKTKAKSKTISLNIDKNIKNPKLDKAIFNKYPELKYYKVYSSFVNPFTNYLAGIFFATQGDYTKSIDLLKETYGMLPKNKIVKNDMLMVENILDGIGKRKINNIWIIYSDGIAPKKEEFKVNIPLFLVTNKLSYSGIALPKLKMQPLATKDLSVFYNNKLIAKTIPLASMDKVISTEFKYKYQDIITRAVFGAIIKTAIQYEVGRQAGGWAGTATGFLQAALTKADTRTWSNLPKEFQVAKIKMPKDAKLKLKVASQTINIDLKHAKNAIIFVKMPTANSKVSYNVIKL